MNKLKLVLGVVIAFTFLGLPSEPFHLTPDWYRTNTSLVLALMIFAWLIQSSQKLTLLVISLSLFSLPYMLFKTGYMTPTLGNVYAWAILASTIIYLIYSAWDLVKTVKLTQTKVR